MRTPSRMDTGSIHTAMRACWSVCRPDTRLALVSTSPFSFRLLATDGSARCGEIATPHGIVRTPAFMPVGTQATVKGMLPDAVRDIGADIVLGNTYHLMLRPGAERIARLGGLPAFMDWPAPLLTGPR